MTRPDRDDQLPATNNLGIVLKTIKHTLASARSQSVRRVARYVAARGAESVLARASHASKAMTLREVAGFCDLTTDPMEVARRLVGDPQGLDEIPTLMAEVTSRMNGSFPESRKSLEALYSIVRTVRPTLVLETGVSIGVSTAVLLAALDRNGCGHLHSVDIDSDVGRVARAGNTDRWTLHVHPHVGGEDSMRRLVAELGSIDVYYHDSGHSWLWQTFEYETAIPATTSLVLSDDVDASWAFADHCAPRGIRPVALVETNKVFAGYRVL